jgi:hypothetical protein
MELEIIHLFEAGSSPKIEIGRLYELTYWTLFTILKNKKNIWYILNQS